MMKLPMSKQRKWQLEHKAKGLCQLCSRPLFTTICCAKHHKLKIKRQRKRLGVKPWKPGSRGYPPKFL